MRSTKNKIFCSSSLWTCLHHIVILRSQNEITDFLIILAWASPFNAYQYISNGSYYIFQSSLIYYDD